jgi:hypothetical protein
MSTITVHFQNGDMLRMQRPRLEDAIDLQQKLEYWKNRAENCYAAHDAMNEYCEKLRNENQKLLNNKP